MNDLSEIGIETSELVVIFSNLLDNALEACLKLPASREIVCCVEVTEHIFISIKNTSPPTEITAHSIKTTKQNPSDHGFGLPNVCRVLDHLAAEYTFRYEAGWFQFAAEIPLHKTNTPD